MKSSVCVRLCVRVQTHGYVCVRVVCHIIRRDPREEEVRLALGVTNELEVAAGGAQRELVFPLCHSQRAPEAGEHVARVRLESKILNGKEGNILGMTHTKYRTEPGVLVVRIIFLDTKPPTYLMDLCVFHFEIFIASNILKYRKCE